MKGWNSEKIVSNNELDRDLAWLQGFFWATWYNESHGGKERDDPAWGITYTGIPLEKGICAVDPEVIPLLTRMYVPGYGNCLAADIGGGIRGNHIDLGFLEIHGDNPWYTGYVEIYILD